MTKAKILLLSLLAALSSCSGPMEIVGLTLHTGQGVYSVDDEVKGFWFFYQSALVKNPSEEAETLKKELLQFHRKNISAAFENKNIITYSTTFYRYARKTAYFIDHQDDPGGHSSEILTDYYGELGVAEIITSRSRINGSFRTEISYPGKDATEILE